jgi:acylphosphatase
MTAGRLVMQGIAARIAHSRDLPVVSSTDVDTKKERAKRYYVSGMVQGVGYRFFAQRASERLGIAGYTKNLRDGRVEVYAIGPATALVALRRELERGPREASVSDVAEEDAEVEIRFARSFSIQYE